MDKETQALQKAKFVFFCVARNRAEPVAKLSMSTVLNEDLGLDGDDVDDLLTSIDARLRIDWSSFDFHKYFSDEGMHPLAFFDILLLPIWLFLWAWKLLGLAPSWYGSVVAILSFGKRKSPFPIALLVWAAIGGKFEDPPGDLTPILPSLLAWKNTFQTRFERRQKQRGGYFA